MNGSSWVLLGLTLIVIVALVVAIVLSAELMRIMRELEYINSHQTNAELTSATRWPVIRQLVAAINRSLVQVHDLRTKQIEQETQVRRLLTNLTHDIKTPLTVASGYVQLMQRNAPENEQLMRVAHNLTSVNYYVRYLMDFNLVQEQSSKLDLISLDLTALVQNQLFDVFDELHEKHLTLTPTLQANIMLVTDASLVKRVVQNLIGNWLKYASGGVRVALRERDEKHVELTMANQTDQPMTNVDHLVERFYTSDTARRDSTGLGLSIVANLMTRLNGTMTISTQDDWFTVTLIFRRNNE